MRYLVDFNRVDDDHVRAVLRTSSYEYSTYQSRRGGPRPGDVVELYDRDGASCMAVVEDRTERTANCRIDWSTWTSLTNQMEETEYVAGQPYVASFGLGVQPT